MKSIRKTNNTNNNAGIKLGRLLALPVFLLLLPGVVSAQASLYPGFMMVEAFLDRPDSGAGDSNAVISISNLHESDPLVLLDITGENFESATIYNENNEEIDQLVIQPGERVYNIPVMLNGVDSSVFDDSTYDLNFFVRRGLEAMEPVEAIEGTQGAFSGGIKAREAGIPNEDEYIVNFAIRN